MGDDPIRAIAHNSLTANPNVTDDRTAMRTTANDPLSAANLARANVTMAAVLDGLHIAGDISADSKSRHMCWHGGCRRSH